MANKLESVKSEISTLDSSIVIDAQTDAYYNRIEQI